MIYSIILLNLDIQVRKMDKNHHQHHKTVKNNKWRSFRYNVKVQWHRIISEHSRMDERRGSNTPGHVCAFVLSEVSGDTELTNLENTPVQISNTKVGYVPNSILSLLENILRMCAKICDWHIVLDIILDWLWMDFLPLCFRPNHYEHIKLNV